MVQTLQSYIQNPYVYNFEEMNDLVDFYEIQTSFMNPCNPKLYNGCSQITKAEPNDNHMLGMEEVAEYLKSTKICLTKITYEIELAPVDASSPNTVNTYAKVCQGKLNISNSCVQNTINFFDKGTFALNQDSGVVVRYLDLDDINNDCSCSSAFMGFQNIVAGLRKGSQTPCTKFDIQSDQYLYK
ncbi:uncharacterized protein LOC111037979 [Myzus persicae]|uniref:uncharacterized protein LOC111037979 n=1 Tax=Myzus persicae TaxID=13164 RepID=UPI000B932BEF|nr:uncharacterized protein LOC111037979 [Myzus persicae]